AVYLPAVFLALLAFPTRRSSDLVRVARPRNVLAVELGHVFAMSGLPVGVHAVRGVLDPVGRRLELQGQALRCGSRAVLRLRGVGLEEDAPELHSGGDRV